MLHLNRCLRRTFSSTLPALETLPSSIKVRRTKKLYADLPSTLVLSDGSVAPPLGDWEGKLATKGLPRTINNATATTTTQTHAEKPIRRRRTIKDPASNAGKKRGGQKRNASFDSSIPKEGRITSNLHDANQLVREPPQNQLAKEILDNLKKFPHCLLLTRVGQFYESYFDQAQDISRLLNIKLTTRKWDGQRVLMCGFPLAHAEKHLKVLVQQNNRFVAMCEEFSQTSANGVKEFERRVIRVITPGTLIDEPFLNPLENNFLLAVSSNHHRPSDPAPEMGLAWIDVSTGEFFSKSINPENFRDELVRIAPREVILNNGSKSAPQPIVGILQEEGIFVSSLSTPGETEQPPDDDTFKTPLGEEATSLPLTQESLAVKVLTKYLREHLLEFMPQLKTPNRDDLQDHMQIDSHTTKALELKENLHEGGTKGSLLSVVKRTVTNGGTRLLARWLCSPSTSVSEIRRRQNLVAFFIDRPHLRDDLVNLLGDMEDTGRVVQKLLLHRGDLSDLLTINRVIRLWRVIRQRIDQEKQMESQEKQDIGHSDWMEIDDLFARLVNFDAISTQISLALDEESLLDTEAQETTEPIENGTETPKSIWKYTNTKWTIKPGFSDVFTQLHTKLSQLLEEREKLELLFQRSYGAASLTLRSSPTHGLHVHLAKAKRDQSTLNASPDFVSIAESGTTRCYFNLQWSQLGSQIIETTVSISSAEKEAFEALRSEINDNASGLRDNARVMDELDVVLGFSNLAQELNLVRPSLTEEPRYKVVNGRHPTVELGLLANGRMFTPNSANMSPQSNLHIITGPNMAGKSTFLRQTALIAVLAQTGSYVPADKAELGIVDRLFSRVGAKDDLFHDRSTFMVEMLETAEILRRATEKSLVIMDEVGRGTTVTDGLAIAYATVHHLATVNRCRALFATHFHELSDMLRRPMDGNPFGRVAFYCTDVDETDDAHFAYSYRLRPGVNRDSHGLKVAQLARFPPSAMQVAEDALTEIKSRHTTSI